MAANAVHGSDSYGSRFYLDENGVLQYSYFQDDFLGNLNRIKSMVLRRPHRRETQQRGQHHQPPQQLHFQRRGRGTNGIRLYVL
ncbi:MAG: hypothetical protein MZU97_26255 [Bacillus subtilis]|nr:hypothetical protein [Bacillus subtilis]